MNQQNENFDNLTDDELEARQREADSQATPSTTASDEAKNAVSESGAPTDVQAEAATNRVAGVASKDGARVLPYSALQAERRNARQAVGRATRAEQELQAARQMIEDLKSGKAPEEDLLSDKSLDQMAEDSPEWAKQVRVVIARNKELEAKQPKAHESEDAFIEDPIQDAIDQIPMLVEWQHGDAEKFGRAVAIDTALQGSPRWKGRPVVDRFAYVAKQVADEYDIPLLEEKTSASTPSNAPSRAVENATRAKPNSLSDFKGGASPDHGRVNFERMSAAGMLNRFLEMSPEEMDAHLARLG